MSEEQRLLLCCDLDRTLIPNGDADESACARPLFRQLVSHPLVLLAYVSGRDTGRIEQAIAEYDLPHPDHLIADVGTTICHATGDRPGSWQPSSQWQARLQQEWQAYDRNELAGLIANAGRFELQEPSRQGRFKLSCNLPLDGSQQATLTTIGQRLTQHGIAASLIWSTDPEAGCGLLDIVPRSAGKHNAIVALAAELAIGHDQLLFAGDSGNDLDVLTSGIHSILVANADDSVRKQATSSSPDGSLYLSRGVDECLNGNYAAGVVEGVLYYQPWLGRWLKRHGDIKTPFYIESSVV
jgi:HAD superfamily hydrolase (TIGR01484 family)